MEFTLLVLKFLFDGATLFIGTLVLWFSVLWLLKVVNIIDEDSELLSSEWKTNVIILSALFTIVVGIGQLISNFA